MSFRAGFVATIGLPNAGKSTLVNAVVGEKVGIVSSKPQTTRQGVKGILTTETCQAIFVDSPGVIESSSSGVNQFIHEEYQSIIKDSDVVLAVLNIDEKKFEKLEKIIQLLKFVDKPKLAIINKVDLQKPQREAILAERLVQEGIEFFSASASELQKNLKDQLIEKIEPLLPLSPAPLFSEELYTTQTAREIAGEVVREKCFEYLHQEIPFGLATQVLRYDESGKILKISVDVVVAKENHKPIVVGQGGKTIKLIGSSSRAELEKIYDQKIFLELFVKVKPRWDKDQRWMKELGYVVDTKN